MTTFLLDTNIASHVIKGDVPAVRERLVRIPMHQVCISAATQGELLFGLSKRGYPSGLGSKVREFLARVTVLPWGAGAAQAYGDLRANCESRGLPLAPLDMMIAAHAMSLSKEREAVGARAVLVTRDRAFARIQEFASFELEDWR